MWVDIDRDLNQVAGTNESSGTLMRRQVDALTLLKRPSVPEDLAKALSWLASSDSDYVTGQSLVIDGGICLT